MSWNLYLFVRPINKISWNATYVFKIFLECLIIYVYIKCYCCEIPCDYLPLGDFMKSLVLRGMLLVSSALVIIMMTSSNGKIFRVTGHLCGEFTGPRWIPAQRPVTRDFDVFFVLRPNKLLSKQSWGWCFETPSRYYDIIVMLFVYGELWWAGAGVGWGAAGLQDLSVFSAIQIWRWEISNRLLRWLDMFIDRIKT